MIVLLKLIVAHFMGDFLLQPRSWVKEKENKKIASPKLYLHVLIHGLLALILLWDISCWELILLIMLSHWVIDLLKVYAQNQRNKARWFLIDQFLHLFSIVLLWMVFVQKEGRDFTFLWKSTPFWLYLVAVLVLTVVSGVVIRVLMTSWSQVLDEGEDQSLENAGKYIGILERLFVFVFVMTNNWEGVGFLLAAKSVFRFGDLKESKDRKLTEYILIGTLLSFGIAIITAMLTLDFIG